MTSAGRKYCLAALLLLTALGCHAQKLVAEEMHEDVTDQTANLSEYRTKYRDRMDVPAGLVKVLLGAPDAQFDGAGVLGVEKRTGEYWVFMADKSTRLNIRVVGYPAMQVNFRDWGIVAHSLHTYVLTVLMPSAAGASEQDSGLRYLAMTVEPKDATVIVDGIAREVRNGEVKELLSKGSHRYQVSAFGYAGEEGTFEIDDDTRLLNVRLQSNVVQVRVECATPQAQLFIKGERRGAFPWSGTLAPGNYELEARLDGHRPQRRSVSVKAGEEMRVSLPALERITGSLNVDFSPIGADVYVDGARVGTSPGIFRGIAVGTRRVEVRKQGYAPSAHEVTVRENAQTDLSGTLQETARQVPAVADATPPTTSVKPTPAAPTTGNPVIDNLLSNMVYVEGGTFTMGATSEQGSDAEYSEKPAHQVTLSSYYIGKYEVTQEEWEAVMGSNPSDFKGSKRPVEMVSWEDCQTFISKLNALTGQTFRLPTEAEWEYAARGGKKSRGTKYAGGSDIGSVAWYGVNSYNKGEGSPDYGTHSVGQKQPNELGLYDMSGNVWEWCSDWYGKNHYDSSPQTNPQGSSSGFSRVFRGGCWGSPARACRVSYRDYGRPPSLRSYCCGLRLAR